MGKLKVYIELIRPFTLIAPIVGFLSGAVLAERSLPGLASLLGSLLAAFLNAASNVNNQYFDLDIDRINKPQRPFPSGRVSAKELIILAAILYLAAILPAIFVNPGLFFIIFSAALISFFYSAPPVRFKKYPFLSNMAIAVARGMLLIVAGWSLHKPVFEILPWFVGSIFALYLLGAASTKDFSDIDGDKKYGIISLPIKYGLEKTSKIIFPFFCLPFLLIPLGVLLNVLERTTLPLTFLAFWGLYAGRLILKNPLKVSLEKNHVSWVHMYLILIFGQIGFAASYLIKK